MSGPDVTWKKRFLLPVWIVRIVFTLFVIAAFSYVIYVLKQLDERYYEIPWPAIIIYFAALIAIVLMDFAQVILFMLDKLHPLPFLIINALQTAFWLADLIMELVYMGALGNKVYGIAVIILMFVASSLLLVYASVTFHKTRKQGKRGNYAPAGKLHDEESFPLSQPHQTSVGVDNTAYKPPSQYESYSNQYAIPEPPKQNHGATPYA